MSGTTPIAWCETTWNPVRGCTRVSAECTNCYAEVMTARFSGLNGKTGLPMYGAGFATMTKAGARWTNKVALIPEKLDEPLGWKKGRLVFVNSMSDLYHEKLPVGDIARVYDVMERCPQHVFQVLTKRPERRRELMFDRQQSGSLVLPHVWEGTSVGMRDAVTRIEALQRTPAAVRFLSCEPLLEDLGPLDLTGIDWLIIGGESGVGARPMEMSWAQSLIDQCLAQGVACFFKQTGAVLAREMGLKSRSGSVAGEWPVDCPSQRSSRWPQEYPRLTGGVDFMNRMARVVPQNDRWAPSR